MTQPTFALIDEMNEVPDLIRRFDPAAVKPWLKALKGVQKVLLTGEGSSRIFPAKNMIARALQKGAPWFLFTEGARQAAEYDLSDCAVIGASNSGRTRELMDLFSLLEQKKTLSFGLTATAGSMLTERAQQSIVLGCGREKAVAATKSVVEQALVYQSLLQGDEWKHKDLAADICAGILTLDVPEQIVSVLARAEGVYFAGRNNGVAEELALKTNEIARIRSQYLEGTYVVHGIEEVMTPNEVVVLVDPFPAELDKIREVIVDKIGVQVIAIAPQQSIFPTLIVPQLDGFDGYFQLLAGWKLLLAIGLHNRIDLDRPVRARKVGNEV